MTKIPNLEERITSFMFTKKMNKKTLARRVGISDTMLRSIFNRNDCNLSTLYNIAKVLDINPVRLIETVEEDVRKYNGDSTLIPMDEIPKEARNMAVMWVESEVREFNDIRDKHKLASDIVSYARKQNNLFIDGAKLALYEIDDGKIDEARKTLELLLNKKII